MAGQKLKIYIGFITYGEATAKYLPYFLPSLTGQTYKDYKILAVDNSETRENENAIYLKDNFPEIELKWAGRNLGFAKAYNLMIGEAASAGAEYFLALNPDMILEPKMVERLVEAMKKSENIAAIAPKILKWDFSNNEKTERLDSLGLAVNQEHRFYDAHQGEIDQPDLTGAKEIFGFTGAAVLLNLKALDDVAFDNGKYKEYFDELMFMYKEDCDLSYRLRLAGWKILLEPSALAYHDRRTAAKGESNLAIALNRRAKSRTIKQWSFLNQWILLLKLKNLPFSWRVKSATPWYQFKSLAFVLLFEPYLLKQLIKLWQLNQAIGLRRKQLKIRVNLDQIEKFMYEN